MAPPNQGLDARAPLSVAAHFLHLGSASQDSVCQQGALLGTREHTASFHKTPEKGIPAPRGAQACILPVTMWADQGPGPAALLPTQQLELSLSYFYKHFSLLLQIEKKKKSDSTTITCI